MADLLSLLLQSGGLAGLLNPSMGPLATMAASAGRSAAQPPSPFDAGAGTPAAPFAGLLNGDGGFGPAASGGAPAIDLPPSTNDPESREPSVLRDGVPLPRPRPAMAGLPAVAAPADDPTTAYAADPSAASAPAPFSMAPAPPAARAPITSPGNPEDAPLPRQLGGQPSGFLGKILDPALAPTLLAIGSGFSGAGSFGSGMKKAFGNAVAPVAQLQQQQLMQMGQGATYRALVARGVSPQDAVAAALDPEIKKSLVGRLFEAKLPEWKEIGRDRNGQPIHGWVDPNKQTINGQPMAQFAAAQQDATSGANDAGLTGEDYLKTLHPAEQPIVKKLVSYDLDPRLLPQKGNYRERMLEAATRYDPDYSASLYVPRAAALKEFLSGGPNSPASIITAGNTAIQHLGNAKEHSDKLGGASNWSVLNRPINWANATIQDLKNDPNLVKYKGASDRFSEEATKFYRGVGGSKADVERGLERLTPGQSPEARAAAIAEEADLIQGKINALQDRYKTAMGPSAWKKAMSQAGSEFPIIQQKSQEAMDRIRGNAGASVPAVAAPAEAAPALPKVASPAEAAKLPKGTRFVDPNGIIRVVP